MNDKPPESHDCDEWLRKVRGNGGEPLTICVACEYHR